MTDSHSPADEPNIWRNIRTFSLVDISWCSEHYREMQDAGCEPLLATFELVQTIEDEDRFDEVVTEPADVDLEIDFEHDPKNPPVYVHRAFTGERIRLVPLCCLCDERDRERVYDVSQQHPDPTRDHDEPLDLDLEREQRRQRQPHDHD